MAEDSRQLEAQALSKGCRCLQEDVMALNSSCYNFALKRTGLKVWHVSVLWSPMRQWHSSNLPKGLLAEDTLQVEIQVYLAALQSAVKHLCIVETKSEVRMDSDEDNCSVKFLNPRVDAKMAERRETRYHVITIFG